MNWGTAFAFLLLVACAAHARRLDPTRRPRTTTVVSAATPQPGGSNGGGDAASGASSPQTPLLAVAGRRRPCGPGTGRRCIPLSGGRREGGGSFRDLEGRTFKPPVRLILVKRRTTTSPPPTTTPSRVASGGEIVGPRGKWLAAGGGCSAEHSCPVGKCCVNVTVGGIAQSTCQNLARQGEYCHAGGQQPPYNRFCPCEGDSQCKLLMPPSPRGGHSSYIGVCQ